MREIKFRAWDKKTKKMRQVTEIVFNTGFYLETNDNSVKLIWVKGQDIIENKEIQIQRQDDFELMQYTGLKDKNGKEIYEGDIVYIKGETKLLDIKGKIEYSDTFAQFIIVNTGDIVNEAELLGDYENIEVLGNIYENQNLLED